MAPIFVSCGSLTINVNHIALVRWSHAPDKALAAKVYFVGDPEPADIVGERAAILSDILSGYEARSERDADLEFMPSLYGTDGDNLDSIQATLVLSGPPDCA